MRKSSLTVLIGAGLVLAIAAILATGGWAVPRSNQPDQQSELWMDFNDAGRQAIFFEILADKLGISADELKELVADARTEAMEQASSSEPASSQSMGSHNKTGSMGQQGSGKMGQMQSAEPASQMMQNRQDGGMNGERASCQHGGQGKMHRGGSESGCRNNR